jgi:hypothetical protein
MLMSCTLFWDITRRRVVIGYRRLGTTDRCNLQGPKVQGPMRCPETSISNYYTTSHNIQKNVDVFTVVILNTIWHFTYLSCASDANELLFSDTFSAKIVFTSYSV